MCPMPPSTRLGQVFKWKPLKFGIAFLMNKKKESSHLIRSISTIVDSITVKMRLRIIILVYFKLKRFQISDLDTSLIGASEFRTSRTDRPRPSIVERVRDLKTNSGKKSISVMRERWRERIEMNFPVQNINKEGNIRGFEEASQPNVIGRIVWGDGQTVSETIFVPFVNVPTILWKTQYSEMNNFSKVENFTHFGCFASNSSSCCAS